MDQLQREREQVINRMLEVTECHELQLHEVLMQREFDACSLPEHTPASLPLLLHQFFINRIHQLVLMRHQLMLRWRRFCAHTAVMETMYDAYKRRLHTLVQEYMDSIARAQRLAAVRTASLQGDQSQPALENIALAVSVDDMLIYLNYLVHMFQASRRFHNFFRILQWYPITHKKEITPVLPDIYKEPLADDEIEEKPIGGIALSGSGEDTARSAATGLASGSDHASTLSQHSSSLLSMMAEKRFNGTAAAKAASIAQSPLNMLDGPIIPRPINVQNPKSLSANPVSQSAFLHTMAAAGVYICNSFPNFLLC